MRYTESMQNSFRLPYNDTFLHITRTFVTSADVCLSFVVHDKGAAACGAPGRKFSEFGLYTNRQHLTIHDVYVLFLLIFVCYIPIYIYICIYIYIYMYTYTYMYIYIYREREIEREIYIYI